MSVELYQGDCAEILKSLPEKSIQCVVTSPPYYGLRDYGTAKWEGGDPECDHKMKIQSTRGGPKSTITGGQDTSAHEMNYRDICGKCGAIRIDEQIGLESTPDEYVSKLVQVFREVKRVLKDDGTLWLNLGDSYAGSGNGCNSDGTPHPASLTGKQGTNHGSVQGLHIPQKAEEIGLKQKDLIGIPWMVAFALRADGWYLRSDIIWAKPNPMPESVKDRPTKSHEYLFLLSKSQKYYYDAEAIEEKSMSDNSGGCVCGKKYSEVGYNPQSGNEYVSDGRRNKRTVWTINTQPFKGAHFAVMPEKLVEPCILAGSKPDDTILDPFNGSGTVGAVSVRNGRSYIGIDLNSEYIEMARERIFAAQQQMRLPI